MKEKEGKYMFGPVKVGEKGQIVIPKDARDVFDIKPGDTLIVLGDENQGMAIMKQENFNKVFFKVLEEQRKEK